MKLSKESLNSTAAYTGEPVKKEVSWTDGNTGESVTADVWVRKLSYFTLVEDSKVIGPDNDQDLLIASRIANAIVDDEGWPIFELSDVTGLNEDGSPVMTETEDGKTQPRGPMCSELAGNLYSLIHEVNALGKQKSSL